MSPLHLSTLKTFTVYISISYSAPAGEKVHLDIVWMSTYPGAQRPLLSSVTGDVASTSRRALPLRPAPCAARGHGIRTRPECSVVAGEEGTESNWWRRLSGEQVREILLRSAVSPPHHQVQRASCSPDPGLWPLLLGSSPWTEGYSPLRPLTLDRKSLSPLPPPCITIGWRFHFMPGLSCIQWRLARRLDDRGDLPQWRSSSPWLMEMTCPPHHPPPSPPIAGHLCYPQGPHGKRQASWGTNLRSRLW